MLKIKNVTKFYDDFKAVDDLSFEVKKGEIYGLLGVNGAGKTTTFRMIMGLLEPTEGKITINNKKINYDLSEKIGFLTEERSLLTKLTVKEQAIYYGILKGMKEKDILKRLKELLEKFGVSEYYDKKIKELSKGNQQKIQFITAIINKPKLLILDEPFSGLDPFNVELFKKEIIEMSKQGSAIIFSSHRMDHVELFCKKITILLNGKSVISGEIATIKKDFQQKNIFVKGNLKVTELKKIKGVKEVIKKADEFEIKVFEEKNIQDVFEFIKTQKNITKFIVEEASLNDIFVEKVGESFEK